MEKRKRAKKKVKRTKKIAARMAKKFAGADRRAVLAVAAVLIVLLLVLIFGIRGCGVSHKSPEGVVKALIESYGNSKVKKVRECYGVKADEDKELEEEIEATLKYFAAHNAEKIEVQECDILSENKNNTYVYVIYKMKLENGQEYPCINTYMTVNNDGKYYVLPPSKVTEDMISQAATDYAKFMTTNTYKNYTKDYDTFIKKNPGYEEKIAGKVS